MGIVAENNRQINTGPIALIWSPPRPRLLEPSFLHAVLRAVDRIRRQHPDAVVCRIFWDSRSCGYVQEFLSAEPVAFAPELFAASSNGSAA